MALLSESVLPLQPAAFARMASWHQRVIKLFLQRTFGSLLGRNLDAEQLKGSILEGFVELSNIALNSKVLNRAVAGFPVQVRSARIRTIRVNIPWSLTGIVSSVRTQPCPHGS